MSGHDQEKLRTQLDRITKDHDVTFEDILQIKVSSTDTTEPNIAAFLKLAKELRGEELKGNKIARL